MWHRGGFAVLALVVALQAAGAAQAGPAEQLVKLAMHPTDPKVMAVRYLNGGDGMLFTRDGGETWALLCDSFVFDTAQNHGPSIMLAIAADGTTLMGTFSGLWHDDAHACNWKSESQYDQQWIGDFALDPLDPSVIYSVTSTASATSTSGASPNGIIRRDASGVWSDFGTKDELLITGIFAVKIGSGRRFYVSGVKGFVQLDDAGPLLSNYVTRVSDDDGLTWTEHVFGTTPGDLRIRGVDPTNPDRIVVSISIPEDLDKPRDKMDDSVLVSSDQGKTWKLYLTVTEIGGVAFAPDGRVFIGDLGNSYDPTPTPRGMWAAPGLDSAPTKLPNGDYPVQCLGYQAATDTLYACQHFWFGTVDQSDGTFTTVLNLDKVPSMVACDGVDMAATCQTQLCGAYCGVGHYAEAPVCTAYDTPTCGPRVANLLKAGDAGEAMATSGLAATTSSRGVSGGDAGAAGKAGATSGKPKARGGCCAVTVGAHRPGQAPLGLGVLLAAILALRRRRQQSMLRAHFGTAAASACCTESS